MLRIIPCVLLAQSLAAQHIVLFEDLGYRTREEIQATAGAQFSIRTGVTLLKMLYTTTDVQGDPDTASGLLVVPDKTSHGHRPLVIYQHGTTNGRQDVPSRLAAGSSEAILYGSMGFYTLAPDYLGLGDSRGFHPYVHSASQASAAIDMLLAAQVWFADAGEPWQDQLFISGYSQGGHAAAALHKTLQDNLYDTFPVTASTPLSGPYSISGVMYDKMISDDVYYTPAYIAYVVLSYQTAYGMLFDDLNDLFKPAFVGPIESFYNREITTFTMNALLVGQLILAGGVMPKLMFKDSVLQAIIDNDEHPFRVMLRDNDLYDWAPDAPMRLYYCTADEQVPFQNSLVADTVMNAAGAADVTAVNLGNLSHGNCATPALRASIDFFESFLLPSSDGYAKAPHLTFNAVFPNPAGSQIRLNTEATQDVNTIEITDLTGKVISKFYHPFAVMDVSDLMPGLYLVQMSGDSGLILQKLVICR